MKENNGTNKVRGRWEVKRWLSYIVALSLAMSLVFVPEISVSAAPTFSGGSGTAASPYLISSASDLYTLSDYIDLNADSFSGKYFKLTNDITVSGYVSIGTGKLSGQGAGPEDWYYSIRQIYPGISFSGTPFSGIFDGNGHVISVSGEETTTYLNTVTLGLFGYTKHAIIKNLGIQNSKNRVGTSYAEGTLVAYADSSLIENCYVVDDFNDYQNYWGGIVGISDFSDISNCYYANTSETVDVVDVCGVIVGALFGDVDDIQNCYYSLGSTDSDICDGVGMFNAVVDTANVDVSNFPGLNKMSAAAMQDVSFEATLNGNILTTNNSRWIINSNVNGGYPSFQDSGAASDVYVFESGSDTVIMWSPPKSGSSSNYEIDYYGNNEFGGKGWHYYTYDNSDDGYLVISGDAVGADYYRIRTSTGIYSGSVALPSSSTLVQDDIILNNGTFADYYCASVATATGGYGITTYSLHSGYSLPSGLSLSSDGLISGTPMSFGDYFFMIDAKNASGTCNGTLVSLHINFTKFDNRVFMKTYGTNFSENVLGYGNSLDSSESLTSYGTLPPGLSLSTDGTLSGAPTKAGNYKFTISVYNSIDDASRDSTCYMNVKATSPSKPTDVKVTSSGSGSYKITWTAPTSDGDGLGGLTYRVYYSTSTPTASSSYKEISSGGTITGLTAGSTYKFMVRATNSSGYCSDSSVVSSTATNPGAPTSVAATRNSDGSVKVTWTAPTSDGDGLGGLTYRVYYSTSTPTTSSSYKVISSGGSITGLTAGTKYYFKVAAVNQSGLISSLSTTTANATPYVDLAYANKTLTAGTVGTAYSASVAHATGGYGTTTYALKSGSTLPAGLTLATNGAISGTPTTYVSGKTFIVTATNSAGSKDATMTLTINKAASSVTTKPTAKTLTYTGSAQALVSAGAASGGTMQYCVGSTTGTWTTTVPTATAVGTYKVYYKVVGDSNHNDVAASTSNYVTATIAKAASSVTTKPTGKTLTYTGSAQALVSAGAASGGTMQYCVGSTTGTWTTTVPTATAVGTYNVYYKVVGDANHNDVAASTSNYVTATIGNATPTYTAPTAKSLTYTGSAQALVTAGTATGGTMQYCLTQTGTYSTTIPTGTAAGTYTVWYKVVGNTGYNSIEAKSVSVTIAKAASSVTTKPTAKTLTYTGSAQALVSAGAASGGTMQYCVGSTTGTWTTTVPTATAVGTYKVYYKVVGDANHNDVAASTSNYVTATINSATPTYTAPTAKSLTYTGSAQALVTAGTATGGTMQYCLTQTGTYSTTIPTGTAAGTYTVWYKVVGNTGYNNIDPQSVTVKIISKIPAMPTDFEAVRDGSGSVKLTWTNSTSDGDGLGGLVYKVEYGTSTAQLSTEVELTSGQSITGLTNKQTYYFRLYALNKSGEKSKYATIVSAVPYADVSYDNKTLTAGTVGTAYSAGVAHAANGYGTTTYALKSGQTLPDGLSLDENGAISGTPTKVAANKTFIVIATNSGGSKEATMTLTINATVPGAPTNASATRNDDGSVTVNWAPPEFDGDGLGNMTYKVYYGTDSSNLSKSVVLSPGGKITGLAAGSLYYFRITAVNASGKEGAGVTASTTPYSKVEYPVDIPSGVVGTSYNESLNTAIGGYGLFTYSLANGSTLPPGLSFTATGTLSGTPNKAGEYTFSLTASNSGGSASATVTMTVDAANPGAPTGVSAVRNSDGSVKVSWTAPTFDGDGLGNMTYKVYYGTSADNLTESKVLTSGGAIDGLTAGATYYFSVAAVNTSKKEGEKSAPAVSAIPYVDVAYANKTLEAGTVGTEYSKSVAHATGGYEATKYVKTTDSTLPAGLNLAEDGTLSGNPNVSGTYSFKVTASNKGGSATATITVTINPTNPGAPTNVNLDRNSDGSVNVSWTAPEFDGNGLGNMTYKVYYGTSADNLTESEVLTSGGTIDGLTAGATYYFSVAAINSSNLEGAKSEPESLIPYVDVAYADKTLDAGTAGTAYTYSVAHAVNGYGKTTYKAAEDSILPEGLSLAEDGTLSGTPTKASDYSFKITATNDGGSATATMSLTINSTKPNAPTVQATSGENGKVTVTWNAPEFTGGKPLTKYVIERSTDGEEFTVINEPLASTEKYTDSNVTNGTTYYYKISVINQDNKYSDPSETVTAKPYKVPEAPQGLTAAAIDKYSIELAWTGIDNGGDDITAYTIKVYSDENYQTEITSSVTVGETADNKAVVSGLTKDTTYYFTVSAANEAGDGAEAKASTKTFTSPSAPQSVSAEVVSSTEIKLTWEEPESTGGQDVVSYTVYYREKNTENEQEWTKIDGIEGTEYTVDNLTPGQTYEFKVTAMNGTTADDESADSEIVEIVPAEAPLAPTIGEVIGKNASVLITSIDVADNNGDAVNKYIVYISTDGENFTKHKEIETSTDSSSNILVDGLTNGTTYQIKTAAVNNFGESEMSNAQTVTVGMPLPPNNVKAVPQSGQKIEITFDEADGQGSSIVGYEVHIGGTKGEDEAIVDPEASENIFFTESTALIYDASDRINGNTVTAYVVAVSDVFENAKSANSTTATAAIGSPSAPEITSLTANEQGIDLTWTASASNGNAKRKYIVTVVDENGNEKKFDTSNGSTLEMSISKEDGAFEPGKTYGVYVTCTNTAGEGPASNTWTFTFGAPQAPEVQEPEMGDKELTVKWSKPENNGGAEIIGYNIYLNDETEATMYVTWQENGEGAEHPYQLYITDYRKNNGEVAYGEGQDNLDSFEVVVDNLANGFAYSVRVTAVNANGEGPSREIEEPVTPATKASAPRDIVANAASANDISVSWNKPFRDGGTAVTGYVVSVTKTGEKNYDTGDYDDISSESAAWTGTINVGTTAEVGNLEAGSRYEVKVAANTAAGTGEYGTATVYTHSKPSKPVITELISGVGETTTLPLTVRWNAPEDDGDSPIIGYDVYVNGAYKMNVDGMISADTTEYIINDVRIKRGSKYDISVVAYNAVTGTDEGNGISSDKKSVTLGTIPAPKDVKVTGDAVSGNLYVTWPMEQYEGIEQYIDRYIIYVNGESISSSKENEVTLTLRPLGIPQTVEVSVFSTFQQEGLKSEPVTITIGAPDIVTGIEAQSVENGAVVTWTEAAQVGIYKTTGYKVYVDGEVTQTIEVDEATELKAELTELIAGKEYSVNVTAVNANGESPMSDTVKVIPYAKPDAPIVKNIKGGLGSFSFTFDEPNGNGGTITGYKVFVDEIEVLASIVDNTVTVSGVEDGEPAHEFYIIAVSDKGLESDAPETPYEVVTGVPSPPENIEAEVGPGSVTITFDKSEDVDPEHPTTDYEVLDNGKPIDPQPEIIETEDGKLIVKIEPLEDGTEHSITIRPVNDIGKGPESDPIVVVPGTPQAPEISNIVSRNGKLSIEWTEPEENSGRILLYTVYVSDAEGSDYTLAATTPVTNAEIGDLTNGKPYLIAVTATNYIGEGAMSDPMSGTPGTASGAVGEITAVPGYADGSCNITLTWDKPEDNGGLSITEYIVEGEGSITVDSANRTAVITGLEKGTEYTYTITPVNSAGNGESKETEGITTLTEPGTPTLVEVTGVNRNVTAVWTAPENTSSEITGYVIYAEPIDGGDTIRVEYNAPIADESGEYTYSLTEDDGIKVNYKYNVSVAAVNIVGEGSKPSPIRVTVTEDIVRSAPGAPRELVATAGDGSVELSWKEPQYDGNSAITKYKLYYGTSVESMSYLEEVDGHTFSFKCEGLKNGTTYYFKVKAINAADADGGEWSDIAEATPTQVIPPSKPAWVDFNNETGESAYETNAQGNAMTIRWNESTGDEMFGQISYKVYVNGDLKTTTTDLSYVLENPVENTQYNIQIKAVNESGAESSSEFIRAYRGLNVRKSSEAGFEYPEQYKDGIYAYIDADYDGNEDTQVSYTKPSAPQNFAVTTDELNTEVILTWTEPANNGNAEIAKYNVYVDGTPETLQANDSGVLLEDGTYKYSYSILGRAVHSFYVTAINAQDLEGDSTPIKYAPIAYDVGTSLSAPADLELVEIVDKTNVVLSWTAVDGADSYILYEINSTPEILTADDLIIEDDTVSYVYPYGEVNNTYIFMISAKSGSTESELSNMITVDTTEEQAEAPLEVTLTPGESSIMVTWNPPANLDETDVYEYIVYVNGDAVEENVSDCTYTINELKTVYVKVAAVCAHGTVGALSETVSYEHNPEFDSNTPPKPLRLSCELKYADDGVLLVNDNLNLTWEPGEIIDGEHDAETVSYNVYIGGNLVAEGVTEVSFTYADGVEAGKDYLVEIEPLSEDGKAGPKASTNVEVAENEYPAPERVTDLATELSEDNLEVTLTWTEASDIDTYYYLLVNGEQQAEPVNSGIVYTLDSSVQNYTFMLKSAKAYSDGTEVTEDSNVETVNIPGTDPTPEEPDYESNPAEFIQYISDGVKNVKVFWKAPEPKENETGNITEYKVVVDGTAVGTVLADASPLVYEIGFDGITDKKVVEIQAYKEISGSSILASTSAKATVTPGCNIVVNPEDYTSDNPTLPVEVTNADVKFDGTPTVSDEKITISMVVNTKDFDMKLIDEYGNEVVVDSIVEGGTTAGNTSFESSFSSDKLDGSATTYSIVISKEGYTSYTITGVPKSELASVNLSGIELYLGDLNGNGEINFEDSSILIGNLNIQSDTITITMGDLNGNGAINFEDKSILARNLNKSKVSKAWADIKNVEE